MPRGGPRQGAPGKSYQNRTDLNAPRALPVQVGPSQQYGQATALSQLQRQVPTANAPLPTPPPLATAPGSNDPTAPQPGGVGGQPPSGPPPALPGELGDFGGPSQNPGEHVMTGAPSGPGAGPEVLPQPVPLVQSANRYLTATDFLRQNLSATAGQNASVAYLLAQMQRRGL